MDAPSIFNLALLKIGVSNGIQSVSDQTREAFTASLVYDHNLRAALRSFPWPFATKYATLAQTQGPVDTDSSIQAWSSTQTYAVGDVVTSGGTTYYCILTNTNQAPPNTTYWSTTATTCANGDWLYAYRYPIDCLFARRIVPPNANGYGRRFNPNPPPFRIGRDVNGLLVYSQQADAVLEYTVIDCDHLWADDLFIEALSWLYAHQAAPSLARNGLTAAACYQMFLDTVGHAEAVASREGQPERPGESEWTLAREGGGLHRDGSGWCP